MLERINAFLWGPLMPAILACAGLWFTAGTGFLQIRRFGAIFTRTLGGGKKNVSKGARISPYAAMSTALASCVGTGNIAGVAAALVMGGPGALFWMWVSAFLSMATKYAEVSLAVRFRRGVGGVWRGGPMYYIEHGLGPRLKWLGAAFAVICLAASMGTGNITQTGALAAALGDAFGVPPALTGAAVVLIAGATIFGGMSGVSRVSERLVPFMTLLYLAGSAAVLVYNAGNILPCLKTITASAFGLRQAGGGALGFTMARAMRHGVARGVFSNEAGMGTSPMAHAAADAESPCAQGLWGALEVFVDTLLMCTLTGLVIMVSGVFTPGAPGTAGGLDGTALTGLAFSSVFGAAGRGFVAVSISLFAVTSVMGWSCYGEVCCAYLFGTRRLPLFVYRCAYLSVAFIGATMDMGRVWALSDFFTVTMLLPNLAAILLLSPEVFAMTREGFAKKKRKIWGT
ncbi:MAG: sodium:alanine symporter family protein [Oscillospiraceae bacterium]|nr:sodium:alanine symporter family protein [Oscillospiraceae bacterium]